MHITLRRAAYRLILHDKEFQSCHKQVCYLIKHNDTAQNKRVHVRVSLQDWNLLHGHVQLLCARYVVCQLLARQQHCMTIKPQELLADRMPDS